MKSVVSNRNHFDAAAEHVDRAIDSLPNEFKHLKFREWLQKYTERVVRDLSYSFATAAESGIRQAALLICNPDFYETKKRRNEKQTKRWKEDQAQQMWEQMQRQTCPTQEQIDQQVRRMNDLITYHQAEIANATKRLEELGAMIPNKPLVEPKTLQ
jgi:hypothetical protein